MLAIRSLAVVLMGTVLVAQVHAQTFGAAQWLSQPADPLCLAFSSRRWQRCNHTLGHHSSARAHRTAGGCRKQGGAGGNIGAKAVTEAKADGYTLLTGQVSLMAVNPTLYRAPGFDPLKNFIPVTQVNAAPLAIVVAAGSPLKSFADLAAKSKAEPGKITYATPGNGTLSHLVGVVLGKESNVSMTHVPYKGAGPAINDLLGQQVDVLITSTSSVAGMIQGGQIRALAVTSPRRVGVFGKVPTLEELGYKNTTFEDWYGFCTRRNSAGACCLSERSDCQDAAQTGGQQIGHRWRQ